jgi:chaperonin GroES
MIKPINKNVLVEKVLQESKTKSGIIVNTDEKEEENIGKVIAVSDDVYNIKVNNKVIFEDYHARKISYEGKEYFMISQENILGIIE